MDIELYPGEIFKMNLYLIVFLLGANIFGIISTHYFEDDIVYGLVPLFDFNTEKNIPTLYSSIALVISSVLLWLIADTHKKLQSSHIPWLGLSLIFLFLSIDETSSIHESIGKPTKETFQASGFFFYAWVIPYGIALCVFVFAYAKLLFELPKSSMILFIVSGSIYVSGAIGLEMLGGRYDELYGNSNITYAFLYTSEELLEMLGIAIFIYALLTYMLDKFGSVTISVSKAASEKKRDR